MPRPRPNRRSKLDPFKDQVRRWITEDHCYNCEAMLPRLLEMGYKGSLSVLKAFVHPLRPPAGGCAPVIRYETKPGEQVQFDWGEFKYEDNGVARKLYGFSAILCYSRMRFATFVKRCDVQTLLRCLMEAFEYFGGLPKAALTDRMKSVLLEMEEKQPRWNALFADAASRNPLRLCPRRLPGNALPPKSAKSAGMATSPTMACCTACLLPLHSPGAWSRSESGMGRSQCGRRANSLWSWPGAPGPRRMSSTRTNFESAGSSCLPPGAHRSSRASAARPTGADALAHRV